jgi:hypothetical protein
MDLMHLCNNEVSTIATINSLDYKCPCRKHCTDCDFASNFRFTKFALHKYIIFEREVLAYLAFGSSHDICEALIGMYPDECTLTSAPNSVRISNSSVRSEPNAQFHDLCIIEIDMTERQIHGRNLQCTYYKVVRIGSYRHECVFKKSFRVGGLDLLSEVAVGTFEYVIRMMYLFIITNDPSKLNIALPPGYAFYSDNCGIIRLYDCNRRVVIEISIELRSYEYDRKTNPPNPSDPRMQHCTKIQTTLLFKRTVGISITYNIYMGVNQTYYQMYQVAKNNSDVPLFVSNNVIVVADPNDIQSSSSQVPVYPVLD